MHLVEIGFSGFRNKHTIDGISSWTTSNFWKKHMANSIKAEPSSR